MEKQKILIADSSDDFRKTLADALRGAYHVRTTGDGREALETIKTYLPDVLVLDLMIPGYDGLSLLQKITQSGIRPTVLATSFYFSAYVAESLARMNVAYIMIKPCDISAMVTRIADMSQRAEIPMFSHPEPRTLVSNVLLHLGIATKLRGYGYLREAVLLMAQDVSQSVTKELYPAVAARCHANSEQVERSIRSAIHSAWKRRNDSVWQMYFVSDDTGLIPRPTNASFVRRLADYLMLEQRETFQE